VTLVFQYGSNCSPTAQLGRQTPRGCGQYGWAETIDNYQLKFDVWSRSNGCAAADLVCGGGDFPAQGVLYEVPDNLMSRDSAPAGRRSFDAIEGDAYVRRSIAVKRRDGTIVEAQTYVVLTPQTGLLTSADYVASHYSRPP